MHARRCEAKNLRRLIVVCAALMIVAVEGPLEAAEPPEDHPLWSELRSQGAAQAADLAPPIQTKQDLVRQAPAISGKFQVRDQTLLPFVGAGFGAGFASERDRALGSDPSVQTNGLFGNGLTKGLMPNEFQMGIRIPF